MGSGTWPELRPITKMCLDTLHHHYHHQPTHQKLLIGQKGDQPTIYCCGSFLCIKNWQFLKMTKSTLVLSDITTGSLTGQLVPTQATKKQEHCHTSKKTCKRKGASHPHTAQEDHHHASTSNQIVFKLCICVIVEI